MSKELTDKQRRFIEEYLVSFNGTKAAVKAGYNDKNANRQAYNLLQNPLIQEELKKAKADLSERTKINQEKIINELAAIAFFDMTKAVKVVKKGKGYAVEFNPTESLDEEQRSAISMIRKNKFGIEIRAHDKINALKLLGEYLGLFEHNDDDGHLDKLDEVLSKIEGNI